MGLAFGAGGVQCQSGAVEIDRGVPPYAEMQHSREAGVASRASSCRRERDLSRCCRARHGPHAATPTSRSQRSSPHTTRATHADDVTTYVAEGTLAAKG